MMYRIVLGWLLFIPFSTQAHSDTLLMMDEIPVWISGVRAAQTVETERTLLLYGALLQWGLVGKPGFSLHGEALFWGKPLPAYWTLPVDLALCKPGQLPEHWRRISGSKLALDTQLALGARLECWLRTGTGKPWRILTVERPSLRPQMVGYMIKKIQDTLELRSRLHLVAMGQGNQLPWLTTAATIPAFTSGFTAELYFQQYAGIKDSSLEYRLLPGGEMLLNSRWQTTGHLLRLPALHPGKLYRLELRYMGMKEFWSMQLMATRPWYLEPLWVGLQVLLFCLLAGMLIYRRYRLRLRRSEMHNEVLQDQLRRLQLQLNPHFLYNALSSIAGLVVNRQYEEANVYLSEFGRLLREAIECSKPGRPFSLKEELIMLERYCRLEQLRFGFRYTIDCDPALQPAEVQLPAMLVQPLVENAILHGVHGLEEAGHIGISYQREGRHFVIRVTDNGPGFKKDNSHQGTGIGLALTRQRIKYMSDLSGADIRFSLVREANHTVATIRFSEWFEEYPNSHL